MSGDPYWEDLRDIAREGDVELSLATHLDRQWRRYYRWYPYQQSWEHSDQYQKALADFDENVLEPLARELDTMERLIGGAEERDARDQPDRDES